MRFKGIKSRREVSRWHVRLVDVFRGRCRHRNARINVFEGAQRCGGVAVAGFAFKSGNLTVDDFDEIYFVLLTRAPEVNFAAVPGERMAFQAFREKEFSQSTPLSARAESGVKSRNRALRTAGVAPTHVAQ